LVHGAGSELAFFHAREHRSNDARPVWIGAINEARRQAAERAEGGDAVLIDRQARLFACRGLPHRLDSRGVYMLGIEADDFSFVALTGFIVDDDQAVPIRRHQKRAFDGVGPNEHAVQVITGFLCRSALAGRPKQICVDADHSRIPFIWIRTDEERIRNVLYDVNTKRIIFANFYQRRLAAVIEQPELDACELIKPTFTSLNVLVLLDFMVSKIV